ncbi:MAG: CCA tRNA nucleotidyltransferase [Candidatus Dadabacteria bacterium]|nr:MAG: CCA tRNA nucleotidyltransferase [Candidatus Dadabacteria bacterium]
MIVTTINIASELTKFLADINNLAVKNGIKLYLVGGFIRDLLLGRASERCDLDFVLEGDAIKFAGQVSEALGWKIHKFSDFLTAKLEPEIENCPVREIDFAAARTENYPRPGALPVVKPGKLSEDWKRRDFTVNTLMIAVDDFLRLGERSARTLLCERIIDPCSGIADLENKIVRVLHPRSFIDDPTRIFRACRYSVKINGQIEAGTVDLIESAVLSDALDTVSEQRKLNEIKKILIDQDTVEIISLLYRLGVFRKFYLFEEDKFYQLIEALDYLPTDSAGHIDKLRVELGLMLFYYSMNYALRDQRFIQLGVGKKKTKFFSKIVNSHLSDGKMSKDKIEELIKLL